MDDFGMLARDFGFGSQGKSPPMSASKLNSGTGSGGYSPIKSIPSFCERDGGTDGMLFDDVFGGPPKYTSSSSGGAPSSAFDYDSAFHSKSSSSPVYDDDIFNGLPGMKGSADSSAKYDHVFGSLSSKSPDQKDHHSSQFDDLLVNLGRNKAEASAKAENDVPIFDDLLPGFGSSSSPAMTRPASESNRSQKPSSSSAETTSNVMEDPFVVLESTSPPPVSSSGLFTDPLDDFSKFRSAGSAKVNHSPASTFVFDDVDPLDSLGNQEPPASSEPNHGAKDGSPLRTGPSRNSASIPVGKEQTAEFDAESFENQSQKKVPVDSFHDPYQFDSSNTSSDFLRYAGRTTSLPSYASAANEINSHMGASPRHEENLETSGDIWLTVSEIPLFTQPTRAPPPSRPPPPRLTRVSKTETRSVRSTNTRNKSHDFSNSTQYSYSPKSPHAATMTPVASQIDELENFAMGGTQNNVDEKADVLSGAVKADSDAAASAAAMKEAMDRAEAKFRHAKEVRERGHQKSARSGESVHLEKDEKTMEDAQEKETRETQERLHREREREEEDREQRRLERAREREREKARQAVERATREARDRAAAEARLRAERAAVEKAQAEARERAERAAVQRAQAEARERAVAEARERAEKAAAEARLRTERASAAGKVNQQKNDDDLESFFSMDSSRPGSASRERANFSDPLFDNEARSKGGPEDTRRTSGGASSNIRKTSSSTNIVDDLTSIFGAAPSSGDFQEIGGETEERRRARLERHQRTQERAAKALAEKNQRELQVQKEQAERHRIAETLDVEIKRWAAGKEGNLRALLSTLQYVLWPECGWQPVSLTDLIIGAAVKKAYRKATLCIHPDKVQQKGANLQQKYIAEKVFDLLKEAWNKFNSEELF